MGLPKIIYTPVSTPVELDCKRGPQNFQCYYATRKNENVSTSGLKETVLEHNDILISFDMPAMRIDDDLPAWAALMSFALGGGQFDFYPNISIDEHYHLVSEDTGFAPAYVGLRTYKASFLFRVVPDSIAPADPSQVLKRIAGISS
jgi:hypothetical protein